MDTFQALADPTRRRIIEIIAKEGRVSASDVSKQFKISPPAVSQHLKVLRKTRLVDMEKDAQRRIYSINPSKIDEIEQWTKKLKRNWESRFQRLENILKNE